MKKKKKGISPLIATVLLIGFTIVLAALVMKWGGSLFQKTTSTQGCMSNARIQCLDVDINVVATPDNPNDKLDVAVASNTNVDIVGFWFRGFKTDGSTSTYDTDNDGTGGDVFSVKDTTALLAYQSISKTFNFAAGEDDDTVRFQVIPIVTYTDSDSGDSCTLECTETAKSSSLTW